MKPSMRLFFLFVLPWIVLSAGCAVVPLPESDVTPETLQFSGERAFRIETGFVTQFTNRHSTTEQSLRATEWIRAQFETAGWTCAFDEWEVINYSRTFPLRNVVCELPGQDPADAREILFVAHHDQAPTTVEGADNDGSGTAILLHLAEIFGTEAPPVYSLVFVSTDGEEYGMLGTARYIQTHPNPENIIAGVSLDNLGRDYYDRMNMELIGQHAGYGPIWLALLVREAAAANGLWIVNLRSPLDQVLDQAVPVSFMDQGPLVAAGVPALGLASGYPPEFGDLHYDLWHTPEDDMTHQSAEALEGAGLVAEALVRQLLSMGSFPDETGPYLYLDEGGRVLRGLPLYLLIASISAVFFAGSYLSSPWDLREKAGQWSAALVHFLGYWLPLVAAILLLYAFVAIGLLKDYHIYPATTKDPELLNPDWTAITLFLVGLTTALVGGRILAGRILRAAETPAFGKVKSLAFLVIGLVSVYILAGNPFSMFFLAPVLAWFLIAGWGRAGRILDIVFFLFGGLIVYALVYFFGFVILRYGFTFLWMFLNMFSTGTITFGALLAGTAVLAAGLAMITRTPESTSGTPQT